MPHLARFQEFHRLSTSTRRHRVLLRQSGGLKRKIPGPSRASLLWLIFSPVAFVFSSYIPIVDLAAGGGPLLSGRASSTYKGMRKHEFQKIGRIKALLLSGLLFRVNLGQAGFDQRQFRGELRGNRAVVLRLLAPYAATGLTRPTPTELVFGLLIAFGTAGK
jgi:hypothetical protein